MKEPGGSDSCPFEVHDEARESGVENDRAGRDEVTAALEAVYQEHGIRLWRAVLLASGSREIAGDAVAEAFAQALRRGRAVRDPAARVWRAAFRIAAGELKCSRASSASKRSASSRM